MKTLSLKTAIAKNINVLGRQITIMFESKNGKQYNRYLNFTTREKFEYVLHQIDRRDTIRVRGEWE